MTTASANISPLDRPSWLMPLVWLGLTLIVSFIAIVFVGVATYNSESAGVVATQLAAFPVGLLWGGLLSALTIQLFKAKTMALRIGVPITCGLLAGIVVLTLTVLFFVVIFPLL